MKPENIDSRLEDIVEAWKGARGRLATIGDEHARKAAERVADELFHDSVRHCLSPLFKAAVKGKKIGKDAKKHEGGKHEGGPHEPKHEGAPPEPKHEGHEHERQAHEGAKHEHEGGKHEHDGGPHEDERSEPNEAL